MGCYFYRVQLVFEHFGSYRTVLAAFVMMPLAGFPEFGPHGTNVTIWGNNFDLRDHAARTAAFFGISVRSC